MKLDDVAFMIAQFDGRSIDEVHYTDPHGRLILKKQTAGTLARVPSEASSAFRGGTLIRSTGMGFFQLGHPGGPANSIRSENPVMKNAILGYLDLKPGLEVIRAPNSGIVLRVLVPEGRLVGYAEPLFEFMIYPASPGTHQG